MLINRRIKEKKNKNLPFLKSCSTRAGYFNNLSLCQQDWIQASFFNIRRDINIKCEKKSQIMWKSNDMRWPVSSGHIHSYVNRVELLFRQNLFQISYAILLRKKNALIRTRVHDSWIGHFSQGKKLRWRQRLKDILQRLLTKTSQSDGHPSFSQ